MSAITIWPVSFRRLRIFRTLSHRPILTLWTGEAFSAIGDEIYKVALVWLAVKMVGPSAGYLSAGQAAAVLLVGLFGGAWADQWDPRKTMIRVDWIRAIVVLLPVIWVQFFPLNLGILIFVALTVSGLNALFEPALQAVIPRLTGERELMQATNGLMGTTSRLARTVGPGLVGLLTGLIPTIHFFTLDAISFLASAFAVKSLHRELPEQPIPPRKGSILESVSSGFRLIQGEPRMQFVVFGKAIASGCWAIVLPLGIAMLVQQNYPGDVRVYGFLLAAYGAGNLGAALVLANMSIVHPMRMIGRGFALMGLAFIAMAMFKSLALMMVFAAVSAIGGPMNDLAHIDFIQRHYPTEKLVQVVRLRMTIEYGGILLCLLLAPELFRHFSAREVVGFAGVTIFLTGITGLLHFSRQNEHST